MSSELSFIRHLGVTQFHKVSLPQLTSATLIRGRLPSSTPSSETGGRAKISPADFPRRETHFLNGVQCGFRWSSWEVGCSPCRYRFHPSCSGSHFYGVTHPGQEQVLQEEPQRSSAVFSFASIPTHIKTWAGLETRSLKATPSPQHLKTEIQALYPPFSQSLL